jgi:hypothetical protein
VGGGGVAVAGVPKRPEHRVVDEGEIIGASRPLEAGVGKGRR